MSIIDRPITPLWKEPKGKKKKPYVSKKIRDSAKGEMCGLRFNCSSPETVVVAHINTSFKGMGNKSPDIFACYACHSCHINLDAGQVPKSDQLRAMIEYQMKLLQKGLIQIK